MRTTRTTRLLTVLAALLLAAPLAGALPDLGDPGRAPADVGAKTYLVGFHDALPRDVQPGSDFHGGRVLSLDGDLVFARVRAGNPVAFEQSVRHDDRVRYVEWDDPEFATLYFVPNDARYGDAGHWGSKKIGAEAAWDKTLGSTAVKVAHIDSGLNKNHEEFAGQSRILQGWDFQNGDSDPNDESGCSWHGTHSTGTHGATINNAKGIAGLAQSTILPIKAFYPGFFGCTAGLTPLVDALKYAGDQGAHLSSNSWGSGSSSSALNDAVQYAHDRGVIHVAAAGNSGPCTNCVGYPWKDKSSITIVVAATTSSDGQASFSSEGPEVDVAAPGVGILSSTSGTSGYSNLDGTSMAAPHVTGTAALVKALNPGFAFADVDGCLKSTALDLGAAGKDDDFGYGRIRADQAVNCGGGGGSPTVPGAPTLTATAGNAQVSLSWTTPSDGGSPITGYNVYRGTASGSLSLLATLGVTNSHVDTGLANGQTYYYQVSAVNAVGEGARSNEASATPSGGEARVYFEDMDDGAQGWTKSSSGDLWHTSSACVTPIGARHLAWTQDSTCTYDTGSRVTNWARSGAISLSGKTQATLKLKHQFDIEQYSGGAYDILRVQVSPDAVSWTTLQQWDSRGADVTAWTQLSYDIDGFAGGSLYVRFYADTVDSFSNNHKGWFIEDVEVTAS